MHSKLFKSVAFSVIALLLAVPEISAQSFRLFAVSDLLRVFEDGYKLPPMSDTIKLFGIRGEVISGQFVIKAEQNLSNVRIETGRLENTNDRSSLSPDIISWNYVGSIPLTKNASNQPIGTVIRRAPALFPDYLMQEKQIDIKEKSWKSAWLTINIPENVVPGSYSGKVTVKSGQTEQSLPLFITVYPLTLPEERHLKVTEWYTTGKFGKYHGIKDEYSPEWFGMLKKYADNMAAHRQNMFEVPMNSIVIRKSATGNLEFDFSRFDQIAQVFWDTKKMDWLETGELAKFGEGAFASTEIVLKDFLVIKSETGEKITVPGTEVIPYLLPAFEDHLQKKGWLDKTYFHIKDEPSHHNALKWIEISTYIHKYAPHLKRIDAVCTSFLFGNIEAAVPKLDHLDAGFDVYKKGQHDGAELWFYTVGVYQGNNYPNKTIDMPLIDTRIMHWLNYKYDLAGYLHWGWNQWTDDPFKDTGEHIGDAWHVYPVKDGVLNSLRWEQMRNGIQDFEYFRMLEKRIAALKDSLGSRVAWIVPTQRSKEIITNVAIGLKEHSVDPEVFYKAKKEVIKELTEFNTSPMIYVQTNPAEHGTVINRSVVELLGWVEPSTKIFVNGNELPVTKDGLFMERYLIFVGDKLEIKARNSKGEKTLTRVFNVTY